MSDNLSEKDAAFARHLVATGDKQVAATLAGYPQPRSGIHRAMHNPSVQAEIARLQAFRLFDEALPMAVDCVVGLLADPKAPAGARVQAAKLVFDRTLGSAESQGREPHEMTGEELARAIAELEAVAAGRAKDVTPEPGVFD